MADVIVTLLDGTKVAKSKVPNNAIYIDVDGKKKRRVYVTKAQAKPQSAPKPAPKPTPKPSGLFGGISSLIDDAVKTVTDTTNNVADAVSKKAKDVSDTISDTYKAATQGIDSAQDILIDTASRKINEWIAQIPFDDTISSLEEYQKKSGKDVSTLTNFIKNLKEIKL